jgi:4-carboxymuconolactone decarboxylase
MTDTKDFPADVLPESRSRVALPNRDDLDDAARVVFDAHVHIDPAAGKSLAGLYGPGGIRLHSKKLSGLSSAAAHYLRHGADFTEQEREVAILTTAREFDSQFEWCAHEREGLRVGLPMETIDIIRHRRPTDGLPETHAVLIEMGRQLFQTKKLDSATYARATKAFEIPTLVDLISLMGAYSATAVLLAAFDVQLPEGSAPALPVD